MIENNPLVKREKDIYFIKAINQDYDWFQSKVDLLSEKAKEYIATQSRMDHKPEDSMEIVEKHLSELWSASSQYTGKMIWGAIIKHEMHFYFGALSEIENLLELAENFNNN